MHTRKSTQQTVDHCKGTVDGDCAMMLLIDDLDVNRKGNHGDDDDDACFVGKMKALRTTVLFIRRALGTKGQSDPVAIASESTLQIDAWDRALCRCCFNAPQHVRQ